VQALRAIDRTNEFRGRFHVLHGALSPLDGIGPEELKIRELLARLNVSAEAAAALGSAAVPVRELILATNPSVEGDATALYLARLIKPLGLRLTKLASGLPVGGMLEYTDRQTIGKALENRMEMG
jgi:recombination protein RecR